ncbi:MAG: SMI1/KNR4 family protein [Coriobacteriia bacterium]|nr:SMI1/KNR4 family protein [Coriobacteriia bacterium]
MNERVKELVLSMDLNPPATERELNAVESELGMVFPPQYREFILESNGAEGMIGENSYLAIWSLEEIVPLNTNFKVNEFTPGLVFFASDGGGVAYAFDKRYANTPIVEIPDISIHIEEAEPCGDTFEEFLQHLHEA